MEFGEISLGEEDIEADDGRPVVIEPPASIKTPPLSLNKQDDRIKSILGATSNDPVPDVDEDTLVVYGKHLGEHLRWPFDAEHCPEHGPERAVTVVRLLDPEEDECDEFYGLLCEVRLAGRNMTVLLGEIEVRRGDPNHPMIEDYSYWFWNGR